MKYALYLAPLIGSGTRQDPWRSKLNNYPGAHFNSCLFDLTRLDLNTCWAEEAVHQAIRSDPDITALSDLCDSLNDISIWLNGPMNRDMMRYLVDMAVGEQMAIGGQTRRPIPKLHLRGIRI